jgi:hypothetical protein
MRRERGRTDRQVLRDCWCRWTAIVGLFALRRPARRRVDPGVFVALRQQLIEVCQRLAEADKQKSSYYARLEEMVRPWINLRVLSRTDQEILFMLLLRCREVERELTGKRRNLEWQPQIGLFLAIAFAAGAAGVALASVIRGLNLSMLDPVRDTVDAIWRGLKNADAFQQTSVVAVIVIIAAIYVVSRSARTSR